MQKDFDLLVKIYRPNDDITHPLGGKLTPYIETLNVGDKIHIEGPLGKFQYKAGGNISIGSSKLTQEGSGNNSSIFTSWLEVVASLPAIKSYAKS